MFIGTFHRYYLRECVKMQNSYHSVILSASEESLKSINKREILHTPSLLPRYRGRTTFRMADQNDSQNSF